MSAQYRTRIDEHMRMASAKLLESGGDVLSMRHIAEQTGVPYNTVRRYVNKQLDSPNYAVVDQIRRYLNRFYEMSSQDYIYKVGEANEAEVGQLVGAGAP